MAITPRSCSTPSAAIVSGRTRRRSAVQSPARDARARVVHRRHHREVLGLGAAAERDRRRRRGREHAIAAGKREQVRRVPAAAALDVERVDRAAAERRERVLDGEASLRPSVWIASWTSWRSARSSAQRICSGPAPTSSWIFSPPPPARRALLHRPFARRRGAHQQRGVDRHVLRAPPTLRPAPRRDWRRGSRSGRSPGSRAWSARPRARPPRPAARASARAGRRRPA